MCNCGCTSERVSGGKKRYGHEVGIFYKYTPLLFESLVYDILHVEVVKLPLGPDGFAVCKWSSNRFPFPIL